MNSFFKKFFRKKNKISDIEYKSSIIEKIDSFKEALSSKKTISFLHFGHLGDIVNSLPVIQELSKTKDCYLYLQVNKKIPKHVVSRDHPFGEVYLSENSINKMMPLLKNQDYIKNVEVFNGQEIHIDLNFFRELPLNFNIDSVRWYFHITGVFPDLSKSYIDVLENNKFKNFIVIMRSLRRQNKYIDYSFLKSYKNLVFLGLRNEYEHLRNLIPNLEYHDSKDFLELSSIIKNSKMFIGNLSFGYALAEALKVPRLLESGPNFPLVYPNGNHGYDFYFQSHFKDLVNKLLNN